MIAFLTLFLILTYCKLTSTVVGVIVNLALPFESVMDEPIPTLPLILAFPAHPTIGLGSGSQRRTVTN